MFVRMTQGDTGTGGGTLLSIITEAGPTRTLSDEDNGATILCTNAGGCSVTVPAALSPGFSVVLVQDAAAQVTLVAGGGLTFLAPAAVAAPYTTADQGSTIGVTKISATRALVYGAVT